MTYRCRRCPEPDPPVAGESSPTQRTSLLAPTGEGFADGFRVVVLAGSPALLPSGPGEPDTELDRQDAIVAVASAVLERGGTLVAPADVGLVSLLAAVAVPYARPHAAEVARSGAPVEAVETGGPSLASRRLLAPYVHRNCLTLLTRDRETVPFEEMPAPGEADGEFLLDAERHRFDRALLDDALGAVVVHPDPRMDNEMLELLSLDLARLAVVGGATRLVDTEWAPRHDPARLLLDELSDQDAPISPAPHALIMELLVDSWLGRIAIQ